MPDALVPPVPAGRPDRSRAEHARSAPRRRTRAAAVVASGAVVAAGLPLALGTLAGGASATSAPQPAPATAQLVAAPAPAQPSPGGVTVSLWEWNWRSIARECTTVLGPKGYAAVQVAPPQDSLKRTSLGNGSDTVLHPWWEVYQPVSYALTSRMGDEREFRQMVKTCRRAGVEVYVDAVINHMTGQGSLSYGGRTYGRYEYAGLYSRNDFHRPGPPPRDCPTAGGIDDFNDYIQVWNCELVGLADLRTDTAHVRRQLARYLNKLIGYGVSGFRVDAAKHIPQDDLAALQRRLRDTLDGDRPYIALEVIPGGPGRLTPWAYLPVGDVLGFDAADQIKNAFKSYNSPPNDGNIGALKVWGEAAGLVPSHKSMVFVQNHDTERGDGNLSYKDGATNVLAHQFLLASGYGTPQVYSSFTWATRDDSPPADADGFVTDTVCGAQWTCLHADRAIANLVAFHDDAGRARMTNWYDDGVNLIAFSRGNRAWIAINNRTEAQTRRFSTGLPAGTYCDVVNGDYAAGTCTGPTVRVDGSGRAVVTVGAKDSVAIRRLARVG